MRYALIVNFVFLSFFCHASLSSGQLIVGHRGASHDAPENTLAAFRLAWERGADGIEGDFHLTSDGRVVCIHDKDTERVAGVKYVVAKTDFDKLRTLGVGAWKDAKWRGEKIPSLEEVLATIPPNEKIFIELKTGPEIVEPMIKILSESSLQPEQIVIISFHEETIKACEARNSSLHTHWLTAYKKDKAGRWQPSAKQVTETVHQLGADGLGTKAHLEFVDQVFLEQYRQGDEDEFHVWVVNDLETARRYQRLGAWSITTDRPGWLHKELSNRRKQ